MTKKEKRCIAGHIREERQVQDIIISVSKSCNYEKVKFTVEYNKEYKYFNIWFWLTDEQYNKACKEYWGISW